MFTSDFLSFARRVFGLTRQDLATRAGISRPYVVSLEQGTRRLNPRIENRIMHALGLDEEKILRLKELYREINAMKV